MPVETSHPAADDDRPSDQGGRPTPSDTAQPRDAAGHLCDKDVLTMITTNQRLTLPTTRHSITHKFIIGGHEGYLTVGLFDDGSAGELFIKMSKEGSTLSGLIQGFCRAFSLALQYGLPLQDACDRFRGMRFEPSGTTNNPDIPEVSSILDYVARYLELQFVRRANLANRTG